MKTKNSAGDFIVLLNATVQQKTKESYWNARIPHAEKCLKDNPKKLK